MKMTNYGHDELYHYGILGMRWGRRKASIAGPTPKTPKWGVKKDGYERRDPSRNSTADTYERHKPKIGKALASLAKKTKNPINAKKDNLSDDAKEAYKLKRKKLSEMSNAELKKLNERTNLERNYKQNNPGALKTGMAIAGTVAAALGTVVALYSNGHKIIKIGQAIVKKAATK